MAFWNRHRDVAERDQDPIDAYIQGLIAPSFSGSHVSDISAQGLPGLSRAFRIRSEHIAALPLVARNSLTGEALDDQPFIITRPNPQQTRFEFFYQVEASINWHGQAVVLLSGFDGTTYNVATVADMNFVGAIRDGVTGETRWFVGGEQWPTDQLLHIKGDHLKQNQQILAPSPIWRYRETLGEVQAQRKHAQRYWAEGSVPPLLVKLLADGQEGQEGHTSERAEELAKFWNASTDGTSRKARIVPPFVDVETLAFAEEAKAWIEGRDLTINDIANIAHLEGYWIGKMGDKTTYANLTDRIDALYRIDLLGDMRRIEESFATLLPRGTNCKFDTSEMLRMNPAEQATTDAVNLGSGALTQGELRRRDGREEVSLTDLPISAKKDWLVELVQAGADSAQVCKALGLPRISFPNLSVQVQPPPPPEPPEQPALPPGTEAPKALPAGITDDKAA